MAMEIQSFNKKGLPEVFLFPILNGAGGFLHVGEKLVHRAFLFLMGGVGLKGIGDGISVGAVRGRRGRAS